MKSEKPLNHSSLNPEQREAVLNFKGPSMILAGAGTGKTRVITTRIAHMLSSGVPSEAIVALSFTNKAAREMRERATAQARQDLSLAFLGTFHSYCLSLLRRYPEQAKLSRGFRLADTVDQLDLVTRALEELNWHGYKPEFLQNQISHCKNVLWTPEKVKRFPGATDVEVLRQVYATYEEHLKLNKLIDFDDCILKTYLLLVNHPEVLADVTRIQRYFMVDEFQDTNFAQLSIILELARENRNICVVGDDDQSIYSWRGAHRQTLTLFQESFPETRVIKLEQNYRCTNVILGAANQVIKNNSGRIPKDLWSNSEHQDPVALTGYTSDSIEARSVTEKILSLIGSGMKPSEIAVLYRANAQARAIEQSCREANIPYKVYGGKGFFERKEVKDFLAHFMLVLNSSDRMSFFRAIATPNIGFGVKSLEQLNNLATAAKQSPFAYLKALAEDGSAFLAKKPKALQFVQFVCAAQQMPLNSPSDYRALADFVVKKSGMRDHIKTKVTNGKLREKKLHNLSTMPDLIEQTTLRAAQNGALDKASVLDMLQTDRDVDKKDAHAKDHVSLMTIHAAKGLEFLAVFLVGLEEDYLPHKNSVESPAAIEEERRLFYVAITRAKRHLYLSYAEEKQTGRAKLERTPSRFIAELPSAIKLSQIIPVIKSKEDVKSETKSKLGALRSWLKEKEF